MANHQNDTYALTFTGLDQYVPFEGGKGSSLLPFQGMTFGRIAAVEKGQSQKGNKTLELTVVVEEEGAQGLRLIKSIPVTGERSDKKPNILALYDVLMSIYSSTEPSQDAALKKLQALQNRQMQVDDFIPELMEQPVVVTVEAKRFVRDDQSVGWSSDLKNFIIRSRYDAAKKLGSHHRPNPAEAASGGGAAATGATAPAPTGTVAASGRSIV